MATPDTSKSLFPKTILFFFFFLLWFIDVGLGEDLARIILFGACALNFFGGSMFTLHVGEVFLFHCFWGISFLMTVASRLVIVESKWAWPRQQKRPRHGPWFGVSSAISMQSIHLDMRWEILYSWFINNETLHTSMSLSEAHEYYILWYLWHTYGTFQ